MAAQYAQYAQTQANLSQELFNDFSVLYLGAKTSNPTQDNQGNPLIVGALYFNTTSNIMKVWNGLSWQNL